MSASAFDGVDGFAGTTVLVTGAGGGLGAAFAAAFAHRGASVVIADIDGARAEAVAAGLAADGRRVCAATVDVTDEGSVQDAVDLAARSFGPVQILVNNAAVMFRGLDRARRPFWEFTAAEWNRILAVNVTGCFVCAKAVVGGMRELGWGKIVNISSDMAFGSDIGHSAQMSPYTASKAGVVGLTRSLAGELGAFGITVNAVAPGVTATETVLDHLGGASRSLSGVEAGQAIPKVASPDDMVGAVLFLSSRESDYMTGQTVIVDGGRTAH